MLEDIGIIAKNLVSWCSVLQITNEERKAMLTTPKFYAVVTITLFLILAIFYLGDKLASYERIAKNPRETIFPRKYNQVVKVVFSGSVVLTIGFNWYYFYIRESEKAVSATWLLFCLTSACVIILITMIRAWYTGHSQ